MSLNIYRTVREFTGQNVVIDNDSFFDAMTCLNKTPLIAYILEKIDKAHVNSELTFIGRTKALGALNKSMLSTGTKTLINIIQHTDKCFDITECGLNALQIIPKIHTGNIIWRYPLISYSGEEDCDISYKGKTYRDFYDFLDIIEREDRE